MVARDLWARFVVCFATLCYSAAVAFIAAPVRCRVSSQAARLFLTSPSGQAAQRLKTELLELGDRTARGFKATAEEIKQARSIIFQLARYNPVKEPVRDYYESGSTADDDCSMPSLCGKWTLVFTDAPDITGLDQQNQLSVAILGRIGQECDPPYIRNVIEWKQPAWASNLPLVSSRDDARVLQKVVTKASASPDRPLVVSLDIAGLQVTAAPSSSSSSSGETLQKSIESKGILPGFLSNQPVNLQGPFTAPFGQFEVLYLDDEMRMILTGQNFVAVNIRAGSDWF